MLIRTGRHIKAIATVPKEHCLTVSFSLAVVFPYDFSVGNAHDLYRLVDVSLPHFGSYTYSSSSLVNLAPLRLTPAIKPRCPKTNAMIGSPAFVLSKDPPSPTVIIVTLASRPTSNPG